VKYFVLSLIALTYFVIPLSAKKKPEMQEGKLVLSASSIVDGYRTYKVALYMGDQGALLWNYPGKFAPQANDFAANTDCPLCQVAQRMLNVLLQDCHNTPADFCQHQMPIRFRRGECTGFPCLGIDFPLDPSRGLEGKHKTLWLVTPIRPAVEVAADTSRACIGSREYQCGPVQ
jgi:hypothetical protein